MGRPDHMHTVPAGYLRAFADKSAGRNKPHIWQYERVATEGKLISVLDACVSRDIYTLRTTNGRADTTIETDLLELVDRSFPSVIAKISAEVKPDYWEWRALSRFVVFQFVRTPRMFQIFRDEGARRGIKVGMNDPQLAVLSQVARLEKWFCSMKWIVCWNESSLPFFTSDNPVVMLADRGEGVELGVGFADPSLEILVPLNPKLCLLARHTPESLNAVLNDDFNITPNIDDFYPLLVGRASTGIDEIVRLNQFIVSCADRYAYSHGNDEKVLLFLKDLFFGHVGPVRRFDRQPIGSNPIF